MPAAAMGCRAKMQHGLRPTHAVAMRGVLTRRRVIAQQSSSRQCVAVEKARQTRSHSAAELLPSPPVRHAPPPCQQGHEGAVQPSR